MALPVAPFLFKFVVLKVLKGAIFGIARFVKRVIFKKHSDDSGNDLTGKDRLNHILRKEWRKKDNVLYLILMLGNALYGAQEICLWLWYIIARRTRTEYCAYVPASLELPDKFVDRVHHLPWPSLYKETFYWLGMASLVYWPMPKKMLSLHQSDSPDWIEVRYKRMTYMVRNDFPRSIEYRNLEITINDYRVVSVKTPCGNYQQIFAKKPCK